MNGVTLPYKHRFRNSNSVLLVSSTLAPGHETPKYLFCTSGGEKHYVSLKADTSAGDNAI